MNNSSGYKRRQPLEWHVSQRHMVETKRTTQGANEGKHYKVCLDCDQWLGWTAEPTTNGGMVQSTPHGWTTQQQPSSTHLQVPQPQTDVTQLVRDVQFLKREFENFKRVAEGLPDLEDCSKDEVLSQAM